MSARSSSRHRSIVAVVVGVAVAVTGCGAGDAAVGGSIPDGYPTVADPSFQGTWLLTGASSDGQPLDPGGVTEPTMEIDVVTGAVTVDLTCNRYLGSYTLAADGSASFTITGGTSEPCPDEDVETAHLDLLDRVDRWERTSNGFDLIGPAGDGVSLTPVG